MSEKTISLAPDPWARAARLDPGKPQPDLSGAIAQCPCSEDARAGLYLLNGDWDLAHRACQDLDTPTAAYWHALVHRHEPDFMNSKYWLRRSGGHPIHQALAAAAGKAGQGNRVAPDGAWDAVRFTDLFANSAEAEWTRDLDRLEMRSLLEHCLGPPPAK